MQSGDHVVSPRTGFTHHGLYIGHNEVIHYSGYSNGEGSGTVIISSLTEFCQGNTCQVIVHPKRVYSHQDSVKRARSRLGESLYDVVLNNCEHFVMWCIEGHHHSEQIDGLQTSFEIAEKLLNPRPDRPLENCPRPRRPTSTTIPSSGGSLFDDIIKLLSWF